MEDVLEDAIARQQEVVASKLNEEESFLAQKDLRFKVNNFRHQILQTESSSRTPEMPSTSKNVLGIAYIFSGKIQKIYLICYFYRHKPKSTASILCVFKAANSRINILFPKYFVKINSSEVCQVQNKFS